MKYEIYGTLSIYNDNLSCHYILVFLAYLFWRTNPWPAEEYKITIVHTPINYLLTEVVVL